MKTYRLKINGNDYNVEIHSVEGNSASISVNGTEYQVGIEASSAVPMQRSAAASQTAQSIVPQAPTVCVKPSVSTGSKAMTSPLPGVIIDIKVKVGDTVKAGTELAVLEAMKMENSIEATSDGTIIAIHVSKGDSVLEGEPIVTIG